MVSLLALPALSMALNVGHFKGCRFMQDSRYVALCENQQH
jgi:hypothetical protein